MVSLRALLASAAAALLLGCAAPRQLPLGPDVNHWQGRLSVRIESEPLQTLSAGFDLQGTEQAGELMLLTPLGSTAAVLSWTPQAASLSAQGEVKRFASLKAMIRHAVGVDLPVAAVFAWLDGRAIEEGGWSADLSGHPTRITARRASPAPATELRMVLDPP